MSLLGKLFQWCLAFLSRRPTRSGNFRPFCCAVPSASRHVSRQDLTEALRRQIRQARWLPLAEVVPRAGNWLAAWPSFWAAETSLPQALRYQGPSSETSCLTGPNSEQLEKGNCYRISALPPKKITGSFGFFFVLVFFWYSYTKLWLKKSRVRQNSSVLWEDGGYCWWGVMKTAQGALGSWCGPLSPPGCWWCECAVCEKSSSSALNNTCTFLYVC